MKPISRPSKTEAAFHKYLKPGALAQLRDSKINSRFHRFGSVRLDSIPRVIRSQTQIQISDFDQIPSFLNKIYGRGPCYCLQRKKLLATKSFLPLDLETSSQSSESMEDLSNNNRNGGNLLINVLNNDVVVAH